MPPSDGRVSFLVSRCCLAGLTRLREEVSTCEYEDVHVLWELLTESGGRGEPLRAAAPRRTRRRDGSHVWEWSGLSFCRRF
ncbi:hypothetical protein BHE74_00029030 [Ensete ventricosum]|uniref:Uncharacterized protein n=1 Tax=Ensete ventricosum TaxID=4639 RepID=A0A426YX20_ENSVE|nr:hypothetical protein B296_00047988 [Ensete ventricosum]RWW27448.1 hypothetical protein GW17_00008122 [Ensete ventricosum]RWW63763.1 hypothetical protein BHE74_00029030 [Ensete ventricosum]RZR92282.1 hypothetical protein BHM03_00020566 [Ensete ventricosum]